MPKATPKKTSKPRQSRGARMKAKARGLIAKHKTALKTGVGIVGVLSAMVALHAVAIKYEKELIKKIKKEDATLKSMRGMTGAGYSPAREKSEKRLTKLRAQRKMAHDTHKMLANPIARLRKKKQKTPDYKGIDEMFSPKKSAKA